MKSCKTIFPLFCLWILTLNSCINTYPEIELGNCEDGIQNRSENGIDCGGPCPECASCYDNIKNGDEDGVDCGGSCPNSCEAPCTPANDNFVDVTNSFDLNWGSASCRTATGGWEMDGGTINGHLTLLFYEQPTSSGIFKTAHGTPEKGEVVVNMLHGSSWAGTSKGQDVYVEVTVSKTTAVFCGFDFTISAGTLKTSYAHISCNN